MPSDPGKADRTTDDEILLARCLEAIATGGPGAEEDLLAGHASRSASMRSHLDRLRRLGFVGADEAGAEPRLPERLGEFRILRQIGRGGMGVVYLAEQETLGRRVAIKAVNPAILPFGSHRERFRREIAAVARMNHPGIVQIHCVGEDGGIPWFAMELVEGCTLADALSALRGRDASRLRAADLAEAVAKGAASGDGAVPEAAGPLFEGSWVAACLRLASQVALALAHVHGRGVVHRDVKPSNIALTRDGRARLMDFGVASVEGLGALTATGLPPGSLAYMSPEQIRGDRDLDARTDVYSLGVTFREMLTLRQPFMSDSTLTIRARVLEGADTAPRAANPAIPRDVETVCLVAAERDPSRRYPDAGAFARDLERLLDHRPIEGRRPGAALRTARWCQRRPVAAAAILMAALGIGAAGGAIAWERAAKRARVETLLADARDLESRGENDAALELTGAALGIRPDSRDAVEMRDRLRVRSEARIRESEARTRRALDDVLRLSDTRTVREYRKRAEALHPALPARIPDFDAWLASVHGFLGNVELHRAALRELEKAEDASPPVVWQREILLELVRDFETLHQLAISVEGRRVRALGVAAGSIEGPEARERWRSAIEAVGRLPVYGGLVLAPQPGLLPLGPDPGSGLWEFVHLLTGTEPSAAGGPDAASGVILVLIPGGTALLGSHAISAEHPRGSPHADPWHRPTDPAVREVRLGPYFLSKFELTQAQWARIAATRPSTYDMQDDGARRADLMPVESVSFADCLEALARVDLGIPGEAEWEFACRAGTTTVFSTGDGPETLDGHANLREDDDPLTAPTPEWGPPDPPHRDPYRVHTAVGCLRPNPWGLHDMHGNVWEWCRDLYIAVPPSAPASGGRFESEYTRRVCRGGSFASPARLARSASRSSAPEQVRRAEIGIRPFRELGP